MSQVGSSRLRGDSDMWYEKYAPTALSEVVGHPTVVRRMATLCSSSPSRKDSISVKKEEKEEKGEKEEEKEEKGEKEEKEDTKGKVQRRTGASLSHLLLYGPPGTGKTSLILSFSVEYFGPTHMDHVLYINASEKHGIETVRQEIVAFLKKAVYPKLIILDEADASTAAFQKALQRIIEIYTKHARFCFIANSPWQLINTIHSRCAPYRFRPLTSKDVISRLQVICSQEAVRVPSWALEQSVSIGAGDLRKCITFVQHAARLYSGKEEWPTDAIEHAAGVNAAGTGLIFFQRCCKAQTAREVEAICCELEDEAVCIHPLLDELAEHVVQEMSLSGTCRIALLDRISMASAELEQMANEFLQILAVAMEIAWRAGALRKHVPGTGGSRY